MGFMGLVGWYLDVITVSFAAVIIGLAVDDTIRFFTACGPNSAAWAPVRNAALRGPSHYLHDHGPDPWQGSFSDLQHVELFQTRPAFRRRFPMGAFGGLLL